MPKKSPAKKVVKAKKDSWGSPKKRDQYTVVVEELRAQFKVFGESLAMTRKVLHQRIDEMEAEIKKEIAVLNFRVAQIDERISKLDVRVSQLEQANLELLKEIRENKTGEEVKALRRRVEALEAKLARA